MNETLQLNWKRSGFFFFFCSPPAGVCGEGGTSLFCFDLCVLLFLWLLL